MNFYHGIIPCYYVLAKDIMDSVPSISKRNNLKEILSISLTMIALALTFLLISPFFVLHKLVELFLRNRYKSNFGVILTSIDSIYESTNPKLATYVVYILRHEGSREELYKKVKDACTNLHNSHYKFSSVVRNCLGYRFFWTNQVHVDTVVSQFTLTNESNIAKESLVEHLEKMHDIKDDGRLWEAKLCTQPILWNSKSDKENHYALVIRTNHTIADAFSLMVYHLKYLANEKIQLPLETSAQKSSEKASASALNASVHRLPFEDLSDFYFKELCESYDHHYVFLNEKEPRLLPMIQDIKNKQNAAVSDVFAAAASASISKYYHEENIDTHKSFCAMTCRSAKEDLNAILTGKTFGNETSAIVMSLPMQEKYKTRTERFKEIVEVCRRSRYSVDRQILYILSKLGDYLPSFVPEFLFKYSHISLAMSNVPLPNIKCIAGLQIEDIFGFVNHFSEVKFVLCILSFRGRLQVSLVAKKGMVRSRQILQKILDDMFSYIEELHEESLYSQHGNALNDNDARSP